MKYDRVYKTSLPASPEYKNDLAHYLLIALNKAEKGERTSVIFFTDHKATGETFRNEVDNALLFLEENELVSKEKIKEIMIEERAVEVIGINLVNKQKISFTKLREVLVQTLINYSDVVALTSLIPIQFEDYHEDKVMKKIKIFFEEMGVEGEVLYPIDEGIFVD